MPRQSPVDDVLGEVFATLAILTPSSGLHTFNANNFAKRKK